MSEFDYMPMFWAKFFADTEALSGDAAKAYLFLLGHAWIRGARLPDDDTVLARLARVAPRTWAALKPSIMALWFRTEDGDWTQKRMAAEFTAVRRKVETNRRNGALGGRPRRGDKKPNKNNGGGKPAAFLPLFPSGLPVSCRSSWDNIEFPKSFDIRPPEENPIISTEPPNPTVCFGLDISKEESREESSSVLMPPPPAAPPDGGDDDERLIAKIGTALGPETNRLVIRRDLSKVREWLGSGCDLERDILPELVEVGLKLKPGADGRRGIATLRAAWLTSQVMFRRQERLSRPAVARGPSMVFVRAQTPQWDAWTGRRGKAAPINERGGWYFPTEWPTEAARA